MKTEAIIRYLLQGFGILLGVVLLSGAALIYTFWKDNGVAAMSSHFLAELGAVVISITTVHLLYHGILDRDSHLVRGLLNRGLREYHPALTSNEFKAFLSHGKHITVVKTFFPEDRELENGVKAAIRKPSAHLNLYLMEPDSVMLQERSLSLSEDKNYGREKVRLAVRHLHQWKYLEAGPATVCLRLYNCWAPPPMIIIDGRIFFGYYFLSAASPNSPWVEVRRRSPLGRSLLTQITLLDRLRDQKDPRPVTLRTREEFEAYMKEQGIEPATPFGRP